MAKTASAASGSLFGSQTSVASAGTVDLGAVGSKNILITGTTTITSFGSTARAGEQYIIEFAAALTLTYNATSMILPSAANITTAAGDTMILIAKGFGNFKSLLYSKAAGTPVVAALAVSQGGII